MDYRLQRFAGMFQNPGSDSKSVIKPGAKGPGCINIRRALDMLGFDIQPGENYDPLVRDFILKLQVQEGHSSRDGLTGPGTRALLAKLLVRKYGMTIVGRFDSDNRSAFPRVFVSYAREDKSTTEQVVLALIEQGVNTWVDYIDLRPGEKWERAIERAIPDSRYFLAIMSRHSLTTKGFVHKEMKIARDVADHYPESDIFVIPARLENCEVKDSNFANLNYIDLFPDQAKGVQRLIDFLATHECGT